jgi:hypothetical protein
MNEGPRRVLRWQVESGCSAGERQVRSGSVDVLRPPQCELSLHRHLTATVAGSFLLSADTNASVVAPASESHARRWRCEVPNRGLRARRSPLVLPCARRGTVARR